MIRVVYIPILLLLVLAQGCVNMRLDNRLVVGEGDWYTEGGVESRTFAVPTTVDPPLEEKWRYDVGAGVGIAGSLVIDSVIFVGNRKGQVLALDIESGKKIGRARFEAPIEGGMSYRNSVLYVPFVDKKRTIVAYDIYGGDHVWRLDGAPVESSLLPYDDTIVVVDSDAIVKGVGAKKGDVQWEKKIGDRTGIVASPVAVGPHFVVANEKGVIYKLDASSGEEQWVSPLAAPVYSTPILADDDIIVSTTRGQLFSLSSADGEVNWSYTLPDNTVRFATSGFDEDSEQLVVAGSDGHVRSLDPATGDENWVTPLEGAIIIAPLFTNNTIYIGTLRGKLYALDKLTGEKIWEHKVTGRIKSAIVGYKEKIIVLAETQQLFVFEPTPEDVELTP